MLRQISPVVKATQQRIVHLKKQIRDLNNKLRSFFEYSATIHLVIDVDFKIVTYNRAANLFTKKYFNVKLFDNLNIYELLHPSYLSSFLSAYAKTLDGIPVREERKFKIDNETLILFISYAPLWDIKNDKIIGMCINAVDITEKKNNEQKIVSQYRSLKEIAYIHSHELRRPVASILGLMTIFKADGYCASKESLLMLEKAIADLSKQMDGIESNIG